MITVGNSSASLSVAVADAPSATVRNSGATPHSQPATRDRADLVQLQSGVGGFSELVRRTEAQQVQQLYRQGHTVPQISSSLNLSVLSVNNYLSISKNAK